MAAYFQELETRGWKRVDGRGVYMDVDCPGNTKPTRYWVTYADGRHTLTRLMLADPNGRLTVPLSHGCGAFFDACLQLLT